MGNLESRQSRGSRYRENRNNRRNNSCSRFEQSLRNRPYSREDRFVMSWDYYIRNFSKFDSEKYPHGSYISLKEVDEFLYALQATPNFYPKPDYLFVLPIIFGIVSMGIVTGIGSRLTGSKAWVVIVNIIILIGIVAGVIFIIKLQTRYLEQRQREF